MMWVIIGLLVVVGLTLLLMGLGARSKYVHAERWPSVRGQVIESRVDDTILEDPRLIFTYSYYTHEREFRSSRISFSANPTSRKGLDNIVSTYPPGSTVDVHFDPSNPEDSVLINTLGNRWIPFVVIGIVLIAVAAGLSFRA